MIINFVGLFNQPGYVGEVSDETHIARELEKLGHTVRCIPRDAWREYCIEDFPQDKYDVPQDLKADINLVAKWHHFFDGSFISKLKTASEGAPVFYWVWDFMYDNGFPEWHLEMAKQADLYLSGEGGISYAYHARGINQYYFQMDVCDFSIPTFQNLEEIHDVIFTGSCIGQGHRIEWLKEINKVFPVKIWSWNYEDWQKLGFEAYPAVYGADYNKLIAQSKIVLGFSVEPNCWGYWSNRVGKVLRAGGFLIQEFAPGMESLLPNHVRFFSSPEEAIENIRYYLPQPGRRHNKKERAIRNGDKFTSKEKVARLAILMDRFIKAQKRGDHLKWNQLP